jgi:hypothetical protein
MASAQQLIGLVKSHAEGNSERFFDLAMQLAAIEEQKDYHRAVIFCWRVHPALGKP